MINQVLAWFEQMDNAYTLVDNETKRIYETLNQINVSEKMTNMIKKSEKVVEALNSLLFKAKNLTKDDTFSKLDDSHIEFWDDQMKSIKKTMTEELGNSSTKGSSSFKSIAFGFLASVAGCMFAAFGFMYWKIQKAIRHKRIM